MSSSASCSQVRGQTHVDMKSSQQDQSCTGTGVSCFSGSDLQRNSLPGSSHWIRTDSVWLPQTADLAVTKGLPDACSLKVTATADAVRVSVFNTKHKGGQTVDTFVGMARTANLKPYVIAGANRVVLTLLNNRCCRCLILQCKSATSIVAT